MPEFRHVCLLHDNTLSPQSELVKSEKVTVLSHAPYSPDLARCDLFLLPKLKKKYCEPFQKWILFFFKL